MIPTTSREANQKMTDSGKKLTHGAIILQALEKIKEGNHERIAQFSGLKEMQVVRRLSELETQGMIRKSGKTNILSTGNRGIIWQIVETEKEFTQAKLF